MDTPLECLPCTCRQALEAVRYATGDEAIHERVLRSTLRAVSETDLSISSPELAARVHRQIRELTGNPDPYLEAKRRLMRHELPRHDLPGGKKRTAGG